MASTRNSKTAEKITEEAAVEEKKQETGEAMAAKDAEIEALKKRLAELETAKEEKKDQLIGNAVMGQVFGPNGDEDPIWEEYEDVYVPRHGKGQEPYFFIQINARSCQIPADGKRHRIRKPFAEALQESIDAEMDAEDFADNVPHDAAPGSYEQVIAELSSLKAKMKQLGID